MQSARVKRSLLTFFIAIGCVLGSACAQSTVTGAVTDPTGAGVAGSIVRLEDTTGVLLQQSVADASGRFTLNAVPSATYRLTVAKTRGFDDFIMTLHVTGARLAPVNIRLRIATVAETINVNEQANGVTTDVGNNGDQATASGAMLEKVPVLDQDVVSTFTPFLANSAVGSKGVTLVVDGIEMKGAGVSASAIKSVSINNDPYNPESRTPGKGRIEIITKTGTSQFHGTVNFTFRDSSLDATTHFALARPAEQKRIFEGSMTGPIPGRIGGGKTTFLISGTRQEDDLQAIVHATDASGAILSENVPTPVHTTLFALRVARDLTPTHRVAVQYNVEDIVARNQGVGGVVLSGSGVNSQTREDDLFYNDTLTLSPRLLNQFQFFLEKDHNPVRSVTVAPKVVVDGGFTGGGAQADVLDTENNLKINDILSLDRGHHLLKAGILIPNLSRRAWEDHANRLGTYFYGSNAAVAANAPYKYTQEAGVGRTTFWANEIGTFVSDQIQVRPNLQISVGLRWDWQTYFETMHDFGPRISLAYSRERDRKTVYRTGYGIFYDRSGARPISELKRFNGSTIRTVTILNPAFPNPFPPGQSVTTRPTDLTILAPDISVPISHFFSFGFDRQLAKGATLSVAYRGNVGINLFRSVDANAPPGPAYLVNVDPSLGVVRQIQSRGRQVSNAVDVNFRGAVSRWFTGIAQYTLGRTNNDTGGIAWFPANQYDNSGEYARADFDQMQRLNLLGTFNEGHWLSLGVAANLNSGTPYTETSGVDTFHTGLLNERPLGIGRNTLQAGGYANLDLRWSHDFRLVKKTDLPLLTLAVDAFNLPNHTNFTKYVGNVESAFFRQPTTALPARRIQFTLRAKF
jgi:hypothetical protein